MEIYIKKIKNFLFKIYKHYIKSLSKILKDLGININTIPVLDVLRNNTNKIIGNRSFSKDKKIVKKLGFTIKYLHSNKICWSYKTYTRTWSSYYQIVIKKCLKFHLSLKKLNKIDFYPFKNHQKQNLQ